MHLERIVLILEVVGQTEDATVSDICSATDLPKPTAYRLVQDLVGVGLLEPKGKGRFALGMRLRRISQVDNSDKALVDVIAPVLKHAANQHGASFFLSRLRGRSVEIVHVETPDAGVSYLHPGLGKRPLHACSCSKVIAAFSPDTLHVQDLEGELRTYTEFTLTHVKDLMAEFALIRARGYAECVEEIEHGMCSVAAPLSHSGLGAALAIGAAGSRRVFTPEMRARLGQDCLHLASVLLASLGWEQETFATGT